MTTHQAAFTLNARSLCQEPSCLPARPCATRATDCLVGALVAPLAHWRLTCICRAARHRPYRRQHRSRAKFGDGVSGLGFAGMLLYGPLSDRYGRRPVLLAGMALFTVASLACWLADSVELMIAARFAQAMGGGAASVLARAVARDVFAPKEAIRQLSRMAMVTSVGRCWRRCWAARCWPGLIGSPFAVLCGGCSAPPWWPGCWRKPCRLNGAAV